MRRGNTVKQLGDTRNEFLIANTYELKISKKIMSPEEISECRKAVAAEQAKYLAAISEAIKHF